ncbi:hypothetical protein [Flavobacterium sp. 3HN19-14]|uniref:hypothetical protein n=1 Tax=Flavobacterium sp. 3HN19-14 TaxID=3448133 RepID=UPI003EE1146E
MKKTTLLLCLTFLISGGLKAQSYTTGMMALLSNNNTNLNFSAQIEVSSTLVTLTLVAFGQLARNWI